MINTAITKYRDIKSWCWASCSRAYFGRLNSFLLLFIWNIGRFAFVSFSYFFDTKIIKHITPIYTHYIPTMFIIFTYHLYTNQATMSLI